LTRLINNSIENRELPNAWKEALVTPIMKRVTLKTKGITGQ
jgi:hypothetical protein